MFLTLQIILEINFVWGFSKLLLPCWDAKGHWCRYPFHFWLALFFIGYPPPHIVRSSVLELVASGDQPRPHTGLIECDEVPLGLSLGVADGHEWGSGGPSGEGLWGPVVFAQVWPAIGEVWFRECVTTLEWLPQLWLSSWRRNNECD